MSALWTREQHEWLQAMGHTVWSMAGSEASTAAEAAPEPARAGSGTSPRPAGRDAPDRLAQALLRACGGDAHALAALAIDTAALHGDAAAKRTLWPRLRALRRSRRT